MSCKHERDYREYDEVGRRVGPQQSTRAEAVEAFSFEPDHRSDRNVARRGEGGVPRAGIVGLCSDDVQHKRDVPSVAEARGQQKLQSVDGSPGSCSEKPRKLEPLSSTEGSIRFESFQKQVKDLRKALSM